MRLFIFFIVLVPVCFANGQDEDSDEITCENVTSAIDDYSKSFSELRRIARKAVSDMASSLKRLANQEQIQQSDLNDLSEQMSRASRLIERKGYDLQMSGEDIVSVFRECINSSGIAVKQQESCKIDLLETVLYFHNDFVLEGVNLVHSLNRKRGFLDELAQQTTIKKSTLQNKAESLETDITTINASEESTAVQQEEIIQCIASA